LGTLGLFGRNFGRFKTGFVGKFPQEGGLKEKGLLSRGLNLGFSTHFFFKFFHWVFLRV